MSLSLAQWKVRSLTTKPPAWQAWVVQRTYLERLKASGDILWWKFEPASLRLAPKTFFKPDFMILRKDGLLIIDDTKGFMTDDANVKIKVAASMFPFQFRIVRKAGKAGGMWSIQNVGPDEAAA